jgi:hypothetical protein
MSTFETSIKAQHHGTKREKSRDEQGGGPQVSGIEFSGITAAPGEDRSEVLAAQGRNMMTRSRRFGIASYKYFVSRATDRRKD